MLNKTFQHRNIHRLCEYGMSEILIDNVSKYQYYTDGVSR